MATKITIDPALVRTIYNLDKFSDAPKIQINNKWVGIEFYCLEKTPIRDVSDFAREYATWFDIDLPQIYIDIHRFKDLAIEWCVGKGWRIEIFLKKDDGYVDVSRPDNMLNNHTIRFDRERRTRLSAELAAINFIWEQIQKEGNQ